MSWPERAFVAAVIFLVASALALLAERCTTPKQCYFVCAGHVERHHASGECVCKEEP